MKQKNRIQLGQWNSCGLGFWINGFVADPVTSRKYSLGIGVVALTHFCFKTFDLHKIDDDPWLKTDTQSLLNYSQMEFCLRPANDKLGYIPLLIDCHHLEPNIVQHGFQSQDRSKEFKIAMIQIFAVLQIDWPVTKR